MKNIFNIYKRDIKNIVTNWVALVVILGLIILPSLYAWFNIKSSWDPYSNTKGIAVAVVNKDKGASFKDNKIDVGKSIVNKLQNNNKMGWKFVDEKEAEWGVRQGKYYASVTIPEDFSYKILSIVRDKQQKPSLIYSVNEKVNAVAPKITDKGVSTVQNEVTKTFIKTVNGIMFDIINNLGVEIENNKPKLKDLSNMIIYVDSKIPEINKSVDELYKGSITLEEFIDKIDDDISKVYDTIDKTLDVLDKGKTFLGKSKEGLKNIAPYIKEDLILAKDINSVAEGLIEEGIDLVEKKSPNAEEFFKRARDKFIKVEDRVDNVLYILNYINKDKDNVIIDKLIQDIYNIKNRLDVKINILNNIIEVIHRGEKPSIDLLNKLKDKSNNVDSILDNIIGRYDSEILPNINSTIDKLLAIGDNTIEILNDARNALPKVEVLLDKSYKGTKKAQEGIKLLKENLPSIESSIHEVAGKLKKLNEDERLNSIIELMKNDAKSESDFISNPIEIKENKIFPIPNYGSSMAPFFTTLSLWVGALILVSIISVNVKDIKGVKSLKTYERYFGRYLTFMTIAIFQALVVSLGDIFLLKVYVSNKIVFVLLSIFISIIFSMIIYTLVSVFGNVGKALGVILLVLQISASGGTFPIEVTLPFFQRINPLLPFTYAIGGMREAVGGIIKSILLKDILMLCIYFVLSILISLLLKKKLEVMNKKFVEKFENSGLVH